MMEILVLASAIYNLTCLTRMNCVHPQYFYNSLYDPVTVTNVLPLLLLHSDIFRTPNLPTSPYQNVSHEWRFPKIKINSIISNCFAWIHSANFSNHAKTCPAGKTIDHNYLRNSKMLISPFITFESDDTDIEDLLLKMKETHKNPGLKKICMEDTLIKEFCRGLLHRRTAPQR